MLLNHLKLNNDKTEMIAFSHLCRPSVAHVSIPPIFNLNTPISKSVKSLGITFDTGMSMDIHINNVCKATNYPLSLLRKMLPFIPVTLIALLSGALINSGLYYVNSIYLGLPAVHIQRLQNIQNHAVALVTGLKPWDHVSDARRSLHWLPVEDRITFKTLCLVHKAFYSLGPSYLQALFSHYSPTRSLRSSDQLLLQVPCVRSKSRGGGRFSYLGPVLWNALDVKLRGTSDYLHSTHLLKTHLF